MTAISSEEIGKKLQKIVSHRKKTLHNHILLCPPEVY